MVLPRYSCRYVAEEEAVVLRVNPCPEDYHIHTIIAEQEDELGENHIDMMDTECFARRTRSAAGARVEGLAPMTMPNYSSCYAAMAVDALQYLDMPREHRVGKRSWRKDSAEDCHKIEGCTGIGVDIGLGYTRHVQKD